MKMILCIYDSPTVAQPWLMGVNTELEDRNAAILLRDGNLDQVASLVLGAARAFAAGGQAATALGQHKNHGVTHSLQSWGLVKSGPIGEG